MNKDKNNDKVKDKQKRSKKKTFIVCGVVALMLAFAGAGFNVWHDQPSFCNAICHEPMDPYVESYYEHDDALLVSAHASSGVVCIDCHTPLIGQQVGEGIKWILGEYEVPLGEMSYGASMCLNESCHNMSELDLAKVFNNQKRNPHSNPHGKLDCENCHYSHSPSVMYCSQCHDDAVVPEGWLTAQEAAEEGVRNYANIMRQIPERA